MPSQTRSPPLTVTVLAALWVSLGRCGVFESLGCDNGKLSLDKDLPADGVSWDCEGSLWPESTQRPHSVDTVYDPVPARQICMDESISYNHSIPNSGAYRPVKAENGEYLYCPPQRWLNNLHHGATVLLYHPCAPLHERLLLSALALSCLQDYVISSHPQLSEHMPVALVSWGHTVELSTVASSDVCDWLETTASTINKPSAVSHNRKYNLLLHRSAVQQRAHSKMKESLRRCCEQTISSLLPGAMETELESNMKKESMKQMKEERKSRVMRAAITRKQSNRSTMSRTEDVQNNSVLGSSTNSPSGNRTLPDTPGPKEAPAQSKIENTNEALTLRATTPVGQNTPETTLRNDSLGFRSTESQKLQTAAQKPSLKHTDLRKTNSSAGVNSEPNDTDRPEALAPSSNQRDSVKHSVKEKNVNKVNRGDGSVKDNEIVDVRERELEHEQTQRVSHSHHSSDKMGFKSVSKPQSQFSHQLHQHQDAQPASYLPSSRDCDGCSAGEHCECSEDSGAAVVNKGLPRTPRTDEAVWAAAALGFLLILLTLSVLHTRLYRHWRTAPSLYWHNPQQDYDSVADVIRRRLRIANRRRKRSRRQEYVLLPSSSSSDEFP